MSIQEINEIFTAYDGQIRQSVRSYQARCKRQTVAFDDLYQAAAEAFFRYLQALGTAEHFTFPIATIRGALYREIVGAYPVHVPRNVYHQHINSNEPMRFIPMQDCAAEAVKPFTSFERDILAEASLQTALDELNELDHIIVALRAQRLTLQQIADKLETRSPAAVCRDIKRIRRQLQTSLNE